MIFLSTFTPRRFVSQSGVDAVTHLQLCVDAAPNSQVNAIAADYHQPQTWFAASGRQLFRSFNDGAGWELVSSFPPADPTAREEHIRLVVPSPDRAGLVVVWVEQSRHDDTPCFLPFISTDCGESWHSLPAFRGRVEDMAWIAREKVPILLLATDQGLLKLELTLNERYIQVSRNYTPVPGMKQPLHAVAVIKKNSQLYVAVAVQSRGGVYLANGFFLAYDIKKDLQGSMAEVGQNIFYPLESKEGVTQKTVHDEDIRSLAVQYDAKSDRVWLWAGAMSVGWGSEKRIATDDGRGCFVWETQISQILQGEWHHPRGWLGGSCRAITFLDDTVLAASQWGGVLHLKSLTSRWERSNRVAFLRRKTDVERNFAPLVTIASNHNQQPPIAMVGGKEGLYLTKDIGATFTDASQTRFDYQVSLPEDWLFVPGEHQIFTGEEIRGDQQEQHNG